MLADHGGDLLHGLDLGAHDVATPLSEHGGYDVDLLAIEDVAQLFAIEPCTRRALGCELCDELVEVRSLVAESLLLSLSNDQRKPLIAGSVFCSTRRILSTAWLA